MYSRASVERHVIETHFFVVFILPLAHNCSNSHHLDFSFFFFLSTDYKVFYKYLQIIVLLLGNGAGIVSSTFHVRKPLNLFHFFQWCIDCIETLFIIVDLHRECFFMHCCKDIFKHRYDFVVHKQLNIRKSNLLIILHVHIADLHCCLSFFVLQSEVFLFTL